MVNAQKCILVPKGNSIPERVFLAQMGILDSKGHSWIKRAFIEHHLDGGLFKTAADVT